MVEAKPVETPTPMGDNREDLPQPKKPRQDKKTLVNVHHPNTYFFKKYANTLIPVSRVFLMSHAAPDFDEEMASVNSAQHVNLNQYKCDAKLSSDGAEEALN